jgi:peptidoglycan/xylan/chitin deacetylase (PgdA/CDA1 family)
MALLLLVLAAYRAIVVSPLVHTRCVSPGQWALTFDDGPSDNIPQLRKVLLEKNVLATFFVNAHNGVDLVNSAIHQQYLKDLYKDGHQIATHTYSHADLVKLEADEKAVKLEMISNDDVIMQIIGQRPVYMRPPYMSLDQKVLDLLVNWGYVIVSYNMDTHGYNHGELQVSLNQVEFDQQITKGSSSWISLEHDFTTNIAEWVSTLIDQITYLGYKFVTIEECLQGPPSYRDGTAAIWNSVSPLSLSSSGPTSTHTLATYTSSTSRGKESTTISYRNTANNSKSSLFVAGLALVSILELFISSLEHLYILF